MNKLTLKKTAIPIKNAIGLSKNVFRYVTVKNTYLNEVYFCDRGIILKANNNRVFSASFGYELSV